MDSRETARATDGVKIDLYKGSFVFDAQTIIYRIWVYIGSIRLEELVAIVGHSEARRSDVALQGLLQES